eukprot:COSAG06_NODE_330_length_17413_cov_12.112510_3_plen_106_part_00
MTGWTRLAAAGPVRGTGRVRVAHAPIDGDGTSWEPPTRQAAVALPLTGAKRCTEPALEKAGPAAATPAKCEQPANALDLGWGNSAAISGLDRSRGARPAAQAQPG